MPERVYKIVDVPGDGSCMYHAIGIQLGTDAAVLRKAAAKFILENPDYSINGGVSVAAAICEGKCSGNERIQAKIEKYAKRVVEGRWGGHLECFALSAVYNCRIKIFGSDGKEKGIQEQTDCKPPNWAHGDPYVRLLLSDGHYRLLK